jgi:hypothetical protein
MVFQAQVIAKPHSGTDWKCEACDRTWRMMRVHNLTIHQLRKNPIFTEPAD